MYNLYRLHSELRQAEHETAQLLYEQLIAEGFTPKMAVSLVYRAGTVDGRHMAREKAERSAYYRQQQFAKQAEAAESSAEGSCEHV